MLAALSTKHPVMMSEACTPHTTAWTLKLVCWQCYQSPCVTQRQQSKDNKLDNLRLKCYSVIHDINVTALVKVCSRKTQGFIVLVSQHNNLENTMLSGTSFFKAANMILKLETIMNIITVGDRQTFSCEMPNSLVLNELTYIFVILVFLLAPASLYRFFFTLELVRLGF